jgi:hypothetical protein
VNNKLTAKERKHIGNVKMLPCSVCDLPGPSDGHHIEQKLQYCVVALCRSCHNSLHGEKLIWKVKKMDELKALNVTIERLVNNVEGFDGSDF